MSEPFARQGEKSMFSTMGEEPAANPSRGLTLAAILNKNDEDANPGRASVVSEHHRSPVENLPMDVLLTVIDYLLPTKEQFLEEHGTPLLNLTILARVNRIFNSLAEAILYRLDAQAPRLYGTQPAAFWFGVRQGLARTIFNAVKAGSIDVNTITLKGKRPWFVSDESVAEHLPTPGCASCWRAPGRPKIFEPLSFPLFLDKMTTWGVVDMVPQEILEAIHRRRFDVEKCPAGSSCYRDFGLHNRHSMFAWRYRRFRDLTFNPLHIAAGNGQVKSLLTLLKLGAEINTPCLWMCHCAPLFLKHLPKKLPPGNVETLCARTPLHTAICCGREETARTLLQQGASTMTAPGLGETALHLAALHGLHGLVDYILEHKYQEDVNVCDKMGFTPLHYALANRNFDQTMACLIKHGADPNFEISDGVSPLAYMCKTEDFYSALCLMDYGAREARDFDTENPSPTTLLHECFPAGPPTRDRPWEVMRELERCAFVRRLVDAGYNVNRVAGADKTCQDMSPLMLAARGHLGWDLQTLVEAGADITAEDPYGRTALSYACSAPPTPSRVHLKGENWKSRLLRVIGYLSDVGVPWFNPRAPTVSPLACLIQNRGLGVDRVEPVRLALTKMLSAGIDVRPIASIHLQKFEPGHLKTEFLNGTTIPGTEWLWPALRPLTDEEWPRTLMEVALEDSTVSIAQDLLKTGAEFDISEERLRSMIISGPLRDIHCWGPTPIGDWFRFILNYADATGCFSFVESGDLYEPLVEKGAWEVIEMLLERDIPYMVSTPFLMHQACAAGPEGDGTLDHLLDLGDEDVNRRDNAGLTPLMHVATHPTPPYNDKEHSALYAMVRQLLDAGANPAVRVSRGGEPDYTALHFAMLSNSPGLRPMLKYLKHRNTPATKSLAQELLHFAVSSSFLLQARTGGLAPHIMSNLIELGASPNEGDDSGSTPLTTLLRILQPNHEDGILERLCSNLQTIETGHYVPYALEVFIKAGADWNLADDTGRTAVSYLADLLAHNGNAMSTRNLCSILQERFNVIEGEDGTKRVLHAVEYATMPEAIPLDEMTTYEGSEDGSGDDEEQHAVVEGYVGGPGELPYLVYDSPWRPNHHVLPSTTEFSMAESGHQMNILTYDGQVTLLGGMQLHPVGIQPEYNPAGEGELIDLDTHGMPAGLEIGGYGTLFRNMGELNWVGDQVTIRRRERFDPVDLADSQKLEAMGLMHAFTPDTFPAWF